MKPSVFPHVPTGGFSKMMLLLITKGEIHLFSIANTKTGAYYENK